MVSQRVGTVFSAATFTATGDASFFVDELHAVRMAQAKAHIVLFLIYMSDKIV
jgi:hypothetical protein